MLIQNPCSPQYIRDQKGAGWMLNVNPVRAAGNGALWQVYFPRPWVIIGIVDPSESSSAHDYPRFNASLFSVNPADMNTYKDMFQNIFLDCAFANTHEADVNTYAVNYLEPGIQSIDFRGYFTKMLGPDAMQTPEQWFNAICQPENMVYNFAFNEAATALPAYMEKFRDLILWLSRNINQKMMGAPGVYTFNQTTGTWSPAWSSSTLYEQYFNL